MTSVRDETRDLLRRLGLTTVFGNPGTTEIGFLRDWPADLRYVLGLQESVVVAMADGYAQAGRRAVLVNLHSAGGVGHGLGQVFNAFRQRTPMIVLAGQQARPLLPTDPFLGATDAALFPRPYVKWSCEPARAADVPAAIARAHHVATQAPCGPTFVSVPADDWDAVAAPVTPRPPLPGFAPDPTALGALAAAIDACERPALVVGPGVDADGAVTDVETLAEKTRAGVWAAPMSSRCSFPEDHRLFLGFLPPERGAVAAALAGHDLVVVLGAPAFTYHVLRPGPTGALPALYLIDDDEHVLARAEAGTGIRSTVRLGVRALSGLVDTSARPAPAPRVRPPRARSAATPIPAAHVFATLADLLPDTALLVEEVPSHLNVRRDHLPVRAVDTGMLTTASGALGYGLPAAVGAALARPDRRVVAVVGDGSSMYGIQALWTAAREQVPLAVVILDNAQYAAVRILAGAEDGAEVPGVDLGGIDFVALATSLGCAAARVERPDELTPALHAALAGDGPKVVHVVVDPDPHPLY